MKLNWAFGICTTAIIAVLCSVACNDSKQSLKQLDKKGLLELIRQLAEAEGKNGPASNTSLKVLQTYAGQYELVIADSTFKPADSNLVQVRIIRDKEFPNINLKLPLRLRKLLTYADFDRAFGTGIESPRPKEPLGFSVMYSSSSKKEVFISAHSKQPPEAIHPDIYEVLIL